MIKLNRFAVGDYMASGEAFAPVLGQNLGFFSVVKLTF